MLFAINNLTNKLYRQAEQDYQEYTDKLNQVIEYKQQLDDSIKEQNKEVKKFDKEISKFYEKMSEYHKLIVEKDNLITLGDIYVSDKKEVLEKNDIQEQVLQEIMDQYKKDKAESDAKNKVVKNYKGCNIIIRKADLTQEREDAIVNPANEDLNHKGGAAKQIALKGGEVLQKESEEFIKKHKSLPTGEATTTNAGDLPCEKVIHVVGPIYPQNSMRDQKE